MTLTSFDLMNQDLSCNMTLVDPSNFNYDNILGSAEGEGCKLNGFTAKYESWLPSPKIGDVLIARRVKVSIISYHYGAGMLTEKYTMVGIKLQQLHQSGWIQGQIPLGHLQWRCRFIPPRR